MGWDEELEDHKKISWYALQNYSEVVVYEIVLRHTFTTTHFTSSPQLTPAPALPAPRPTD